MKPNERAEGELPKVSRPQGGRESIKDGQFVDPVLPGMVAQMPEGGVGTENEQDGHSGYQGRPIAQMSEGEVGVEHKPVRGTHEQPGQESHELLHETSELTERVRSFVARTCQAFGDALVRAAMHAAGLGLIYEVCHWVVKAANVTRAVLSDHGAELSLPVPIGRVDLMVSLTVGDGENGDHPVSMFVAPGEDSLAAAIEIGPAEEGEGDATHPPYAKEAAKIPSDPVPDVRPVTKEDVKIYGQLAVVTMDLSSLKRWSRMDRVAVLCELAVKELWQRFFGGLENEGLSLIIGYDPAMGLAFWVCTGTDSSCRWYVVAEYNPVTGCLVIK